MSEPNRTARAEATRRHLLDAATEVFAARGYRDASVAAITEAAGTAHGTFYLYFENREDAFLQVVAALLDELYRHSFTPLEELPDARDPRMLRERIAGFLEVSARHGGLWRALLEGALASPAVEARWAAERERFRAALVERMHHYAGTAGRGRDERVEVAAYALASMLEWYAISGTALSPVGTFEVTDEVVDTLTALWLGAVGVVG